MMLDKVIANKKGSVAEGFDIYLRYSLITLFEEKKRVLYSEFSYVFKLLNKYQAT
jgi:hypothetical protein